MTNTNSIGIIGAGAWGTACAQIWATNGHRVLLWARRDDLVETINTRHLNPALPGITLHENIIATTDAAALAACNTVVYALPAQVLRAHLTAHPLQPHQTLVIAAKGIEIESGKILPDVVGDICPAAPVAVLSGPNIAGEIARGLPAASTIACGNEEILAALQAQLATKYFRLYPSTDIIGVSVGGAVKNVILIAAGIVDGLGLGENARAAVLTRGLAEMTRLTDALGGKRETLMGLSGVGDLFLQTRNYRFGIALARGMSTGLSATDTIEGVPTARAVVNLAGRLGVEMPLCIAVAACLSGSLSIAQAIEILLQRPPREDENA